MVNLSELGRKERELRKRNRPLCSESSGVQWVSENSLQPYEMIAFVYISFPANLSRLN